MSQSIRNEVGSEDILIDECRQPGTSSATFAQSEAAECCSLTLYFILFQRLAQFATSAGVSAFHCAAALEVSETRAKSKGNGSMVNSYSITLNKHV